jgi:hypothetical protein
VVIDSVAFQVVRDNRSLHDRIHPAAKQALSPEDAEVHVFLIALDQHLLTSTRNRRLNISAQN